MWQLHNPIISLLISTQSETIRTTRGNWYFQYSSHVFLGNYRFRWNKRHLKYRFSHSFIDYLVTKIWHLLKRAIRGEVSWCQVSLSWREKQREDNNVLSLWLDRPRRVWSAYFVTKIDACPDIGAGECISWLWSYQLFIWGKHWTVTTHRSSGLTGTVSWLVKGTILSEMCRTSTIVDNKTDHDRAC